MSPNQNIVFFDGDCNLCNRSVRILISIDKNDRFRFTSLQSEYARNHLPDKMRDKTDSIVLMTSKNICIKSSAILKILYITGGYYRLLYVFIIIPAFIRNLVYDLIAKTRYRFFGKGNSCLMPSEENLRKFFN